MLKDPVKAGFDISQSQYMYVVQDGEEVFTAYLVAISSEEAFAKSLKTLFESPELTEDTEVKFELITKDAYKEYTTTGNPFSIAWNDQKMVFMFSTDEGNASAMQRKMWDIAEGQSYINQKGFDKLYSHRGDISAWGSYSAMLGLVKDVTDQEINIEMSDDDAKDMGWYMALDFNQNDVELRSGAVSYSGNTKYQETEAYKLDDKFRKDLVKYFPTESYMTIGLFMNSGKLQQKLEEDETLNQAMRGGMIPGMGLDLGILASFEGDVLVSVHGFDESESAPLFTAGMHMKNDSLYRKSSRYDGAQCRRSWWLYYHQPRAYGLLYYVQRWAVDRY